VLRIITDVGVCSYDTYAHLITSCAHVCTVPPVFDGALVAWVFAPTVLDVPGNLLDLLAYFEHCDKPFVPCFPVYAGARGSLVSSTRCAADRCMDTSV
jgi:hypothetical protein